MLTIRGCDVQAPGGLVRTFLLPLASEEDDEKQLRRRSALQNEAVRHKYGGLESRPWELAAKRMSVSASGTGAAAASTRFLECVVVPEQPLLRIRRTSLTHGAVMLYNGER
jgi:trafficking protein particle complex subunit 9